MEDFLEGGAKRIVKKSEQLWKAQKKITRPMAYLLGYFNIQLKGPSSGACPLGEMTLEALKLFQDYYKKIKDNHGLKAKNVYELYFKLGFELSWFGSVLVPDLELLGEDRGKLAHYSSRMVAFLDPEIEWKRVVKILSELEKFDNKVQAYLDTIK